MNLKKHFALLTLLFFSVVLSAQVKEKMITISFSKIPLSEAMARIEKTSGYTFFYDATQVNVKQEVSLNVKQVSVSKAVGEMLKGIDLSFEVTSTQIALFPKKSTPAQTGKATTIIGKVVDENGEPIIGANVLVAGTTTGVITDIDGNYKLEAPFGSSLQISYIGYTTQTVKAGQKSIIKMKEDSKTLEEVVVVGYGVMKKKDLTGADANLDHQTEYLGDALNWGKPYYPETFQTKTHEYQWSVIAEHPYIIASYLWNMFDFAVPMWSRGGVPARNLKGLMTFDRKIKKDSYYWYKANWSKSPVLYLTQRRNTDRERKQTSVTVYSNIGTPKVYLNGKELTGIRKGYTDVHYIFDQVTLEKGKNKIKAVAVYNGKEYVDEIEWDYQSEKKRDADAHENKNEHAGW